MTQLPNPPRRVREFTASRPEEEEPEIGGSNHEDTDGILAYRSFFFQKRALSDLVVSHTIEEYPTDLEVQPCIPIIFVMGVSGAGKSSLIKALGGKDSKRKAPETDPAVSGC